MRGKLRWQADNETTKVDILRRIHRRRQRLRRIFARQQSQHDLGPAGQGYSEVAASAASWRRSSQPKTFQIETIVAHADSDIEYGYDEDWTFVGFDPNGYSSTDLYKRDWKTTSAELRLRFERDGTRASAIRPTWVVGVYGLKQDEDLHRVYTFRTPRLHQLIRNRASRVIRTDRDRIGGRDDADARAASGATRGEIRRHRWRGVFARTTICGAGASRSIICSATTPWSTRACRAAISRAASIPTVRSMPTFGSSIRRRCTTPRSA